MTRYRLPTALFLCSLFATTAHSQSADPGRPALNPLAALKIEAYRSFVDRPLFSPTRRPPPEPVVEAPEAEPLPEPEDDEPDIRLLGVISSPEGAIARIEDRGETHALRQGERYGTFTVVAIAGSSLTLSDGERQFTISIFRTDGTPAITIVPGKGAPLEENAREPREPDPDQKVRVIETWPGAAR